MNHCAIIGAGRRERLREGEERETWGTEMEKASTYSMGEAASGEVVEEEEASLPGFRFHPTDDELIGFYLRRKVEKRPISIDVIKQVDIYKYDPWDLPRVSNVGDKEWYFFCQRGRKYRNSIRPNRVTCSGFWKATGIDRPVYASGGGANCIGLKKSLVYYRGSAGKGTKTDWMMHEFRLPAGGVAVGKNGNINDSYIQEAESWTICRIFKRSVSHRKHAQCLRDAHSRQVPSESNSVASSAESNNSVVTYLEEKHQIYEDQWNTSPEAPSAASFPSFESSNSAEFGLRDGSWDELGRIVEFSVDLSNVYV